MKFILKLSFVIPGNIPRYRNLVEIGYLVLRYSSRFLTRFPCIKFMVKSTLNSSVLAIVRFNFCAVHTNIYKTLIRPQLTYVSETWTVGKHGKNFLSFFSEHFLHVRTPKIIFLTPRISYIRKRLQASNKKICSYLTEITSILPTAGKTFP